MQKVTAKKKVEFKDCKFFFLPFFLASLAETTAGHLVVKKF